MGFCSRCGEIAFAERCRCGGKVKDSSASGLNGRDAWKSTYLDNKKPSTPSNLVKLGGSHIDHKLTLNELPLENKTLPLQKSASETSKPKLNECEKCKLPITGSATTWIYYNAKKWHKDCMRCKFCNKLMDYPEVDLEENPCCSECFDIHGPKSAKSKVPATPEISVDKSKVVISRSPSVRPKSQFIAKSNTEPQVDFITDKAEKLDIKGSRLSTNLEILRSKSKSFSKTFDTLQADIERSSSVSRHKPKLSGDMTGTLSYKDLLSHRSSISRTPSINRDVMGTFEDRRTKRMSVPANFSQPGVPKSAISSKSATPDSTVSETPQPSLDSSNPKRNIYNSRRSTTYLGNSSSSPLRPSLSKTKEEPEPISPIKFNPSNGFKDTNITSEVTSEPKPYDYSDSKDSIMDKAKPDTEANHRIETTKSSTTATAIDTNHIHSITNTATPVSTNGTTAYSKLDNHTNGKEKSCSKCYKPFTNKWYQLTDNRALHPECFLCQGCNQSIKDGIYSIHEDKEYHSECLPKSAGLFSPDLGSDQDIKCNRCLKLIQGACYTLSDGRNFHMNCFICNECSQPFKSGSYIVYEGKEFHKECIPKLNLLQCNKCKKSIQGKYVQNKGNNFHPECFSCYGCNKHISPNTPFGELESKPYCEPCLSLKIKAKHSNSFALSAAYQERRKRDSALYN